MRAELSVLFALAGATSAQNALEVYICTQGEISVQGLLNNTGTNIGGLPGVVAVAIPIPAMPAVDFTWIRDAAIPYTYWFNQLSRGDETFRPYLDDAIIALINTQTVVSPSGNITTGGLAEPRFTFNLTADVTPYARPENDGPALRAIIFLQYANWLLKKDNGTWVADDLWPKLDIDLAWISDNWNTSSFELWDVIWTESFWTASVQYRAMHAGAALAKKLGHRSKAKRYAAQAKALLAYMQTFWDADQGFMHGNTVETRSGIDSAAHLASIFNFDRSAGCDAATFQPCSDRALSSLKVTIERFKASYPISKDIPPNKPGPAGEFLEDPLGGGYPWYFPTFGAAEQLYYALATWHHLQSLRVTDVSLPFFALFDAGVTARVYHQSTARYQRLTASIREYADGLIMLCAERTPKGGLLAQGWNKTSGEPLGLPGLSRSYAAALMAFDAREGKVPDSWGATTVVG